MALFPTPVIKPMVITMGATPLSQGPSLFPAGWRPAWGPIERAAPPRQARIRRPLTPIAVSARGTGPKLLVMGQTAVPAPQPAGIVQPFNAPRLQQGKQNPPWWRLSFGVWRSEERRVGKECR